MATLMAPQPYFPAQNAGFNLVTRRPLTDLERQLSSRYYKTIQNGLRGVAMFSLVLYIFYSFVIPGISDPITVDSLSMIVSVFMLAFGAVAIGMSINAIVVRKKISEAIAEGTGVEVFGPAYRGRAMKNVQSWTIGPVSIMASRELEGMLQEGAQTSVLCIPKLKVAIAVNNVALKRVARAMFPPDLESMAVPVNQIGASPTGQLYQAPAQGFVQPIPQNPQPLASYSEDELPPPPPDL